MQELLDLDTLVKVKKAAPKVTVVPFDVAAAIAAGMYEFSKQEKCRFDVDSHVYWTTTVKTLSEYCHFGVDVTLGQIGRALKAMGIESWRKTDGFHIAWSQGQLDILMQHFKT